MSRPMRKRNNQCGKQRYRTYEHAKAVRITRSHTSGRPLRIYRCPDCRGFHLTKQIHGSD